MTHEAKLVSGPESNPKVYFGTSGSPDREVAIATAQKSNNKNVKKYMDFLDSISGNLAHAEKTNIRSAYCCAEPHAILKALADGANPSQLRFEHIHDLGEITADKSATVQHEVRNASPCEGFCGKYIKNMRVDWSAICTQLVSVAKINAEVEKELNPGDGFGYQKHQRDKIKKEGREKIAQGNERLTKQARKKKFQTNAKKSNTNTLPNSSGFTDTNPGSSQATTTLPPSNTIPKPSNNKPSYADIARKM